MWVCMWVCMPDEGIGPLVAGLLVTVKKLPGVGAGKSVQQQALLITIHPVPNL